MKKVKSDRFHFKQFSVTHKRSSMKVGTDGVLLGAWVGVAGVKSVLDIGTGTGVISLMIVQRTGNDTAIDAVEINEDACRDAEENFSTSPWHARLHLHAQPIQSFQPGKTYDLVVSNPPYFINSYKPSDAGRQLARHTDQMTFENLIEATTQLLNPHGRLAVILPPVEGATFEAAAEKKKLYCIRKSTFRARENKPVERVLMEFAYTMRETQHDELLLYKHGDEWTDEYKKLTGEFYLKV
ncbi:MAG: methyltransferase [Cyclobacteriaceae bacterium]|nr:methyltransferase [Cyclobacteriaceae bacterium]